MSLRSAGELAATAFFGCSFTTEAFLAKLQVENVYEWYFTSGRMAQNRYVLAAHVARIHGWGFCSINSAVAVSGEGGRGRTWKVQERHVMKIMFGSRREGHIGARVGGNDM